MSWYEKALQWKCPLLPCLTLQQYWLLFGLNLLAMLVYWAGRGLDWWPATDWVGSWFGFSFLLLAFTPLDFAAPRVCYLMRHRDTDEDFVPVPWIVARQLRNSQTMEVHRVIVKDGQIVEGKQLS